MTTISPFPCNNRLCGNFQLFCAEVRLNSKPLMQSWHDSAGLEMPEASQMSFGAGLAQSNVEQIDFFPVMVEAKTRMCFSLQLSRKSINALTRGTLPTDLKHMPEKRGKWRTSHPSSMCALTYVVIVHLCVTSVERSVTVGPLQQGQHRCGVQLPPHEQVVGV